MKAPDKVKRLIEVFDRNLAAYKSSGYKEANVRSEFIDPFFEALEWDVYNKQGYAEAYKDVITEDAIKIGGVTKAPDYCFRIGGARKFFVEAKKPSVDIKSDISPAYQLRRYAWSAGLPLSILTDFEEFAVYDCRIRPQLKDKSGKARVIYLTFRDYIDKWEEISSIFSKKAVLEGFFDKYVESKKKRSTQEVDAEFLKEIENWRLLLARNIALRNSALGTREINFAVQRTIDRIIFLRICEDRGIESYGQLQALLNGANIYERLRKIFRSADEKYNSGLFHFHREKDLVTPPDELTLGIKIDDRVLKEIFKQLYYPDSPYEFSVLGADILGHIYEQFLGKVIKLTKGHQAKVEEKPEVRKAGGVYYTPTYIVDYIVKNTVGKLCEKKTPKQIEKLRILDPACGSGSFLIGAYNYLNAYHRDWYLENLIPQLGHEGYISMTALRKYVPGKKPEMPIYQGKGAQWYLTTREKKRILLNNIYGVDIDSQAVEVTKLSLLLKVLENENQDTLEKQMKLWRERALPDLGNNIKCGNSLIGPDFYDGEQLTLLDDEEENRINAFDWNVEFLEIMQNGGFDAIIGNPPYGAIVSGSEMIYLASKLRSFSKIKDIYVAFIETVHHLLNTRGFLGYIIPSAWTGGPGYLALREFLLTKTIDNIVLLPFDVFADAYIDTLLLIIKNNKSGNNHIVRSYVYPKKTKLINVTLQDKDYSKIRQNDWQLIDDCKLILDSRALDLFKHLQKSVKTTFSDFIKIKRGVLFNKNLLTNEKDSEYSYPYFEGSIYRYITEKNWPQWIEFGPKMKERPKEFFWFTGQRILLRRLVNRQKRLMASLIQETVITNKNLYTIIPSIRNITSEFLLGILNSKLISYLYLEMVSQATKDDFPQVTIRDVLALPFQMPEQPEIIKLDKIVKRMLELKELHREIKVPSEKTQIERQIKATDSQIDQLVYELYGLDEKEIKVIEDYSR